MEPSGNRAPYDENRRVGEWKFFAESGEQVKHAFYNKDGLPDGEWSTTVMMVPKDARRITAMDKDTDRKRNTKRRGAIIKSAKL